MRKVAYVCDRCGKPVLSRSVTKLNITIQRGMDSTEKKMNDFCPKCFLKMKNIWLKALSKSEVEPDTVGEPVVIKPDASANYHLWHPNEAPVKTEPVEKEESEELIKMEPVETEDKPMPKKRGRKPKVVDPNEWVTRTATVYGAISVAEKNFILQLYADGLSVEEISKKVCRLPRGINRAINAAAKSGELDKLKAKTSETKTEVSVFTEDTDVDENTSSSAASNASVRRSSYVEPANMKVIDGKKYDVGCILALAKAGWPPSEIAKEKNYDEDMVRIILENNL